MQRIFKHLVICLLTGIVICFYVSPAFGGVESVNSFIKGPQVATGAVVTAQDLRFQFMSAGAPSSWNFTNKLAEGWLIAGVDRSNTVYAGSAYDVDLKFDVQQWTYNYGTSQFDASSVTTYTVQVSYDPTASVNEIELSRYLVPAANVHKVSFTLTNMYQHGTTTPVSVPQNLYIEAGVNVERYHDFDETTVPASPTNYAYDINADGFKDELEIKWQYIQGAEEYDLEWTFVNNYHSSGSQGSIATAASIPFSGFDFNHNCTRVRITDQHYRIPLLMDRGYVLYRVRGVGRGGATASDFDKIVCGKWSKDFTAYTTVNDFVTNNHYYKIEENYAGDSNTKGGHEKEKNWQVTTTFAEDGKKKEVISYFDGTLRNRQTVTRINSADSIALIGETIYDHQGRAAIQTLPAPTSNTVTASKVIKFYPFFSLTASASNSPYNRTDFDLDANAVCTPSVTPMDTNTTGTTYLGGASKYYSSKNLLAFSHRDYIPTAKGFPFTLVEYEPDNTNRIRTQTGVGADHKLTSGHETKYYYGQPEQEQLDRLFATEVGYSEHYKKNMVIDANGQTSVSYLDMQGRTVATSLAGDSTGNLLALKDPISNNSLIGINTNTITVDLLNKVNVNDTDTPVDNNKVSTDSTSLTYSAQKLVAAKSDYLYYYSLTAPSFTTTCNTQCFPPVYDLEVHVKDQCGDEWLASPVSTTSITAASGCVTTYSLSTGSDDPNSGLTEQIPGAYTVEKVLKVNQQAVANYANQYILGADSSCMLTKYDFIHWNLNNGVHLDGCDLTCAECVTMLNNTLGTRDTYTASATCTVNPTACAAEWDALYEECNEPCRPVSVCQTGYQMLLLDVSPGGQYGATSGPDFGLSVFNYNNQLPHNNYPTTKRSWLAPSTDYVDDKGQVSLIEIVPNLISGSGYIPPIKASPTTTVVINSKMYVKPHELLNTSDFLNLWQPSWAKALVAYHPEYKYFEWCDPLADISGSFCYSNDDFDQTLRTVSSYTLANAATIGTCTVTTDLIDESNMTNNLLDKDPFFAASGFGGMVPDCLPAAAAACGTCTTYKETMKYIMNNYQVLNGSAVTMDKFAAFTNNCGTWYASNYTACPTYSLTFGQGSADKDDQEWNIYKNYYLAEKQKLMQQAADQKMVDSYSVTLTYNFCGCIGEDPYSPFLPCPYIPEDFGNKWSWSGSVPVNDGNQPCSWSDYTMYKNKARRYGFSDLFPIPPSTTAAISSAQDNADYQLYQQTGVCPMANYLKLWLNDMVKQSYFTNNSGNVSLFGVQGFTPKLYTYFGGSATTYSSYTWTPTATSTVLTVSLSPTPAGTCSVNPVLALTAPSGYNWTNYGTNWNITSFRDISPTSSYSFDIKADVDHDNNSSTPTVEEIFKGNTGSCMNLTNCSSTFTTQATVDCTPSDEVRDLAELMNMLSANSKIAETSYGSAQDVTTGTYSTIFNRKLKSYLPAGTYKWQKISSTEYRITDNASEYLKIDLTSGNNIADGKFIVNMNSVSDATYKFIFDVVDQTSTVASGVKAIVSVGTSTVTVNSGTCGYPNDCKTVEHDLRTDLEYLLNGLVTSTANGGVAPASSGTQLSGTKWFSQAMHDHLSVKGTESFSAYDDNAITANSFTVTIKDENNEAGGVFCNIDLYPVNSNIAAPSYTAIASFSNLTANENKLVNGKAYEFVVTYSLTAGGTGQLAGTSCFPIKNCITCIPSSPNLLVDCDTAYADYLAALDALGNLDANPAFAMPDSVFCDQSLERCWEEYINYLDAVNCTTSTQSTYISLQKFCAGGWNYCAANYTSLINYINGCSGLTTTYPGLIVSLEDFCVKGLGAKCSTDYKNYISAWCNPETRAPSSPLTMLQYCEGYIAQSGCDPFPPTIPSYTISTPADPCSTYQNALATANALSQYNAYVKSWKDNFIKNYTAHCIKNAIERFEMTYRDKEYNFTLYYYDEAGNLVRTIPPAGVNTLSLTAIYSGTVTVGEKIKTDRMNNTRNVYTSHAFPTTYRYNSLNQLIAQSVPDNKVFDSGNADEVLKRFSSRFWYDALGRLAVSQNSKQYNAHATDKNYSYTRYDDLGRTIEVGQATYSVAMTYTTAVHKPYFNHSGNALYDWIAAAAKTEVTKTFYDAPIVSSPGGVAQQNLRNRVTAMTYSNTYTSTPTVFDYGVHYSYDVHGNVKSLVQDNQELHNLISASINTQRYKVISYNYDLISGNVNDVFYEKGDIDQFAHHYEYDADNRIINVYTSDKYISPFPTFQLTSSVWEQEAKYFYYPHGPLARVELGHNKVQGTDHAYTIQGWMKGVNSNSLKAGRDMGKDGHSSGLNTFIAQDEFGYSLNYFAGDYGAIGQFSSGPLSNNTDMFLMKLNNSSDLNTASASLYNGNIRNMVTSVRKHMPTGTTSPQAMAYKYDQLNRILSAKMFDNGDVGTDNEWDNTSQNNSAYQEGFRYDHNGNILKLNRNGTAANNMDQLTYWYYNAAGGVYDPTATAVPYNATNQLAYVDDAVSSIYNDDIDDQASGNYEYDEIGNLKKDVQEQIGSITWTVYGKVKSVTRSSGSKDDLEFKYDPAGNRICKIAKPQGSGQSAWVYTWYVRDAQGNTMGTYKLEGATATPTMTLTEQYLYGSSRLGIVNKGDNVTLTPSTSAFTTLRGTKNYELSNHLGNVLAVVSDQIIPHDNSGTVDYYNAETVSANDYYSFGSPMPGRQFNSDDYRYGFNGKEREKEMHGNSGDAYDFGARLYDTRSGRWMTRDPFAPDFPNWSPYAAFLDNPIQNKDIDGKFAIGLHYAFTANALEVMGYSSVVADLLGHYASTFADHPSNRIANLELQPYRSGIDYSKTSQSQNTASIEHSTWHSMTADNEKITPAQAKKRGQEFGWSKILEAGAEGKKVGGLKNLKKNTAGIEAFGQGMHALQDAEAHQGVKMKDHSIATDMAPSTATYMKAFNVTKNAIVVAEIISGDFSNLKSGMTIDLTGTTMEQYNKVRDAIQNAINGTDKKIILTGKPKDEKSK